MQELTLNKTKHLNEVSTIKGNILLRNSYKDETEIRKRYFIAKIGKQNKVIPS